MSFARGPAAADTRLQTHGRTVTRHMPASDGRQPAGIDHSEVTRGQVLAARRSPADADHRFAGRVAGRSPRPLKSRQRVRVHIGTAEVLARVAVMNEAGELRRASGRRQLKARIAGRVPVWRPIHLAKLFAAQTIGGGEVLDPHASRVRKRDFAEAAKRLGSLPLRGKCRVSLSGFLSHPPPSEG